MAEKDSDVSEPLRKIQDADQLEDESEVKHASDIYGEWGPLQLKTTIFFIMIYVVASFQNTGVIFYLPPIDYHCKLLPEYADRNVSKCFKFEGSAEKCTEWEFDHSFYEKTVIDEFELVCDREHYISITQSIYQIGFLVSSISSGWMSDKYGRLFTFKFSIILELMGSMSQALAMNINHFLFSRFFLAIGAYGRFSAGLLLLFELVGPRYRASICVACEFGWCISILLLPIAHYFLPHFRYMQLMVFGYEIIFLIWLWRLPDSPRWLIAHDRFDEAAQLITNAAKAVKKLSDTEIEAKVNKLRRYLEKEQEKLKLEAKKTIIDLWRQPNLLRYCILLYTISICMTFITYSIEYNAASFGISLHRTMFVQALSTTGIFTTLFYAVNRFRRKSLSLFMAIGAICAVCAMLPFTFDVAHLNYLTAVMFIAKFFSSGWFPVLNVMQGEIFPTTLRQISMGSCSVAMRVGAALAPYSRELTNSTHLSVLIGLYAILTTVIAVCVFFLPETSEGEIPDTIDEALQKYSKKAKEISTKSESI